MALNINTNIGALGAAAAASSVNKSMETSMTRLSTGLRINTAADDAAGVAIGSRLTSEIRGTNQAIRNAMDAQALIDTAEGAHNEITNILQRMRELSVQAANDTNSQTDRDNLQAEVDQLVTEIDRIANVSSWAGEGLINEANTFKFQIGARGVASNSSNEISVTMNAMTSAALGVGAGNATVGANGATLTAIGGSGLQVGGTPVDGDVYSFDLNGETFTVEITGDDGTDFSFAFTVGNETIQTGVTANEIDDADFTITGLGNDAAAVANAIANFINEIGSTSDTLSDGTTPAGSQRGMTAAASDDGSVIFTQTVSVTSALWADADGDVDGTWSLANDTLTFDGLGTDAAYVAADDTFSFTFNGVDITFDADTYNSATGDGIVAALQAALDDASATELKGFSFTVAKANAGADVEISWTSATLLENVEASPATTTDAILISSQADASAAIATIDAAISTVNTQRANLGAVSNRLDSTVSNMTNIVTNLEAGRSRILDADFAAESTNLAKSQILQQASMAMLAQANASKQGVLQLLQG